MIPETKTIVHRHWGACNNNGHAPHRLVEFMRELAIALDEIPSEYRKSAEIDFDPDYEFGDHHAAVRVTYERPMTPAERDEYIREERTRIEEAIVANEEWNAKARTELASMDSSV